MRAKLEEMKSTQKPIRCAIVQISSLGDTIQSLMALRAVKQLYPQLEITFIVREKFAIAVERIPWIHRTIRVPVRDLLNPFLMSDSQGRVNREKIAIARTAQWLGDLIEDKWDYVVNWSYTEASAFLSSILPAHHRLGFNRDEDTSLRCADDWSLYIQGVVKGQIPQNIHLTDILTTQFLTSLQMEAGPPEASSYNDVVTSRKFFTIDQSSPRVNQWLKKTSQQRWMTIHLSAEGGRCPWNSQDWCDFVERTLQGHPGYRICLIGGPEAKAIAHDILQNVSGDRVESLVGQADFELSAAVISQSRWLVSFEQGTIHLAAVLGVRVLFLSNHHSEYMESGPYGNGHFVVHPTNRQKLTPVCAYAGWSFAVCNWLQGRPTTIAEHLDNENLDVSLSSEFRLLRSRIRLADDGGGVVYEPIDRSQIDFDLWHALVIGQIARSWYCGWVAPIGQDLEREDVSPALLKRLRVVDESIKALTEIMNRAAQTAMQMESYVSKIRSDHLMPLEMKKRIKEYGIQLAEIDQLAERVTQTEPGLLVFTQLLRVMQHNLPGNSLRHLARSSSEAYQKIAEGAHLYRQWLEHTLKVARPIVISQNKVIRLNPSRRKNKEISP